MQSTRVGRARTMRSCWMLKTLEKLGQCISLCLIWNPFTPSVINFTRLKGADGESHTPDKRELAIVRQRVAWCAFYRRANLDHRAWQPLRVLRRGCERLEEAAVMQVFSRLLSCSLRTPVLKLQYPDRVHCLLHLSPDSLSRPYQAVDTRASPLIKSQYVVLSLKKGVQ